MSEPLTTLAEIEALEGRPALSSPAALPATPAAAPVKTKAVGPAPKKTGRPANPDSYLPRIFDNQAQCSGATGIPIAVLKLAKTAGCPAFRHSRVDLVAFLRWRFGQSEDALNDWGENLKEWKAKREKIAHDRDANLIIDRPDVQTALAKGMALLFQKIDNEFGLMLPPILKGLPEIEIQKRLLEAAETFKSTLRDELQALAGVDTNQPTTNKTT